MKRVQVMEAGRMTDAPVWLAGVQVAVRVDGVKDAAQHVTAQHGLVAARV
jgi:hypothetical protein